MNPLNSIEIKLCQLQAKIFERSVKETNYSSPVFIRRFMFSEIAKSLSIADKIFLLPVYSAGEEKISHSSAEEIIKNSSKKITLVKFDDAAEKIKNFLKPGDLFLTMGAGDVYKIGEKLALRNKNNRV